MVLLAAFWPFRPSPTADEAERLLGTITWLARQPSFFGEGRIPDTLEGRLELMSAHACLALHRLATSPDAGQLAQSFTDRLFSQFDAGLREAAVGDLAVPKRMHSIAGRFYGRAHVYAAALASGDEQALEAALARNIWRKPAHPFAAALARYLIDCAVRQANAPVQMLARFDGWAPAPT